MATSSNRRFQPIRNPCFYSPEQNHIHSSLYLLTGFTVALLRVGSTHKYLFWIPKDQSPSEWLQAEEKVSVFSPAFSRLLVRMFKTQDSWQNSTTLGTKRGNILFCPSERYWHILPTFPWEAACGSGWDIGDWSRRSVDPALSWLCPKQVTSHIWFPSCLLEGLLWDMWEKLDTERVGSSSLETSQGVWDKPRNLKSFLPVKLEFPLPKRQWFLLQCSVPEISWTQDKTELAIAGRHERPRVGFTWAL